MTQEKTLSRDTNTALGEIVTTIKSMGDVYKEETEALSRSDNKAFMALQDKKVMVARKYQNDMSQILARKDEVKLADSSIKRKIEKMQAEFEELSRDNMEAINRMQRCTEKLGNTIRNAAIRENQSKSGYGYGDNGAISSASKKRSVSAGLSENV